MGLRQRDVRNAHRDQGERYPTDAEFREADDQLWDELDAELDAAARRPTPPATPTLEPDEQGDREVNVPLEQHAESAVPPPDSGPVLPPVAPQRSRGCGRGRRGARGRGQAPQRPQSQLTVPWDILDDICLADIFRKDGQT